MPAEWEKHEATWIGWPHNPTDWPEKIGTIQWVYGEIVRKIAPSEIVRILVNSATRQAKARAILKRVGADLKSVAIFSLSDESRLDTRFRADFCEARWAASRRWPSRDSVLRRGRRYPDWKKDDAIPPQVARKLKYRFFPLRYGGARFRSRRREHRRERPRHGAHYGRVLARSEGAGAQSGAFSRAEIESALKENLGVTNIVWLGKGIAGDDTHGHVDDLCRFVDAKRVVLIREKIRPTRITSR